MHRAQRIMTCASNDDTDNEKGVEMEFANREAVENLTDEQAIAVIQAAMENLQHQFHNEGPVALDDGGDYLYAALENYNRLFHAYWDNDGEHNSFRESVKQFLLEPEEDWLGSDGEIRFDLVPWASTL